MKYILSDKEDFCIFCDCRESDCEFDIKKFILYRGEKNFVIMNKFPYNNGHLMVVPYNHTDTLSELHNETMLEMMKLAKKSEKILREAMNPDGFNIGINMGTVAGAGIADHIHLHIVPRWNGDTNFMPVLGDVRVVPQALKETYENLEKYFREIEI
jgi:ATP adenylyltransferase